MQKYCMNCGKELKENADVCLNCGVLIKKQVQKTKKYGNGFAIASMILGIIATMWTMMELISISEIKDTIILNNYSLFAEILGFAIGYTLFALIPSALGIFFSLIEIKNTKNGFNISGIILNGISITINIIIFIYILTIY